MTDPDCVAFRYPRYSEVQQRKATVSLPVQPLTLNTGRQATLVVVIMYSTFDSIINHVSTSEVIWCNTKRKACRAQVYMQIPMAVGPTALMADFSAPFKTTIQILSWSPYI